MKFVFCMNCVGYHSIQPSEDQISSPKQKTVESSRKKLTLVSNEKALRKPDLTMSFQDLDKVLQSQEAPNQRFKTEQKQLEAKPSELAMNQKKISQSATKIHTLGRMPQKTSHTLITNYDQPSLSAIRLQPRRNENLLTENSPDPERQLLKLHPIRPVTHRAYLFSASDS